MEEYRGVGWKEDQILKWLKASNDFYGERLSTVKMTSWYDGRVALVGDAAYCPSAATGMGTTSSIVGAYILAGEIGKYCRGPNARQAIPGALKGYDSTFRPFMDQVQEDIRPETGYWNKVPSSP